MKSRMCLETTSMSLHIIAMTCMLCDHLWGTIVPGNDWLTCVGRILFPIFAFLIVEGYQEMIQQKSMSQKPNFVILRYLL